MSCCACVWRAQRGCGPCARMPITPQPASKGCMPSCCSARSSLRHHHEEVIAEAAQQRPAADAPIPAPQPLEPCGMTVFHPGHVGGWGEKAERPAMYEGE